MTAENIKQQIKDKSENIDATSSKLAGIAGLLETGLRRFRTGSYIIGLVPLYFIGILGMGISVTPGVLFFNFITDVSQSLPSLLYYLILSTTLVTSYFIYGFVLIFCHATYKFFNAFSSQTI